MELLSNEKAMREAKAKTENKVNVICDWLKDCAPKETLAVPNTSWRARATQKAKLIDLVLFPLDVDHRDVTAKMGKECVIRKSPSGKEKQHPCYSYLKEQCTKASCDYWHPHVMCQAQDE